MKLATLTRTKDRFLDLPDEIIHHILSYLPMKVAAQTAVLSRRWKHIWYSYPVFDFCQNYLFDLHLDGYMGPALDEYITPKYWGTVEKLAIILDQKLMRFSEYKIGIKKFKLFMALVDQEFHSYIDNWMEVVSKKHVKELDLSIMVGGRCCYVLPKTIFAAKSLTVLKICGYNLALKDPFMESAVDLHSLQILSLEKVYVDEKTTQNLISSCPFVEDLYLSFSGDTLQSLNVYGLVKLVNLTVKMCTNGYLSMKLSGCQGLQRVSLDHVALDCAFDDANFPQIESISLTDSIFSKGFRISSHQLKTLKIVECYEELNIFAPNLISVHHRYDSSVRPIYLPFLNENCKLKVQMDTVGDSISTSWYIGLKEYLQRQKETETLEASFYSEKVEFDREEAEKGNCLWPPRSLKCLEVDVLVPSDSYAAMMNGFFWCCRPQVLSCKTFSGDFVEFLFKMLTDREDEGCCTSSDTKCWRHSLKDFVIFVNESTEKKVPLCWDTFQKALPYYPGGSVLFHLTWLPHSED
ncbi:hypothetical protein SLA2020_144700 [Shorea laevis]